MRKNQTHEKRIKDLENRLDFALTELAFLDGLIGAYRERIRMHFHDDDGVTMFRGDMGDLRVVGHPLEDS